MRVIGVVEQNNNRYKVETSFTESEMAVIVNEGLKSLLAKGQLPIRRNSDQTFDILSPNEAYKREDTGTGYRNSSEPSTCVGTVESERRNESDPSVGLRSVLGSEVVGSGRNDVLLDPPWAQDDAEKGSQTT